MKLLSFFTNALYGAAILGFAPATLAKKGHHHDTNENKQVGGQNPKHRPAPLPPTTIEVDGAKILRNTSSAVNVALPKKPRDLSKRTVGTSVASTILIIARDAASAFSGYSGLQGYGIPYEVLIVPAGGVALPSLTSSATAGKYGAIVVLGEVSYDTGNGNWQSAITATQWATIYQYQLDFGVRLVRIDVFPNADTGTEAVGGCCSGTQEQLMSVNDTSAFPTSGLKVNAGISTIGMWHYPAKITNSAIAKAFLKFGTSTGFTTETTGGVINNIGGRQQMVFFIPFATDWNSGSNVLQHAWIHWATRGLYAGYRRLNFNTQIDDMFMTSDIYYPGGTELRIDSNDMTTFKNWITTINAKLPSGSSYVPEIGHNGNGNIEIADTGSNCGIGPIDYPEQIDTPLEFQKPLGTGTNLWPSTPVNYPYSLSCVNADALKVWFANTANRDKFFHMSHTFTHEGLNNATYFDANREIVWNKAWLNQVGLSGNSARFSPNGLIPPAITGLHNGDVIQAWLANGISNVVGDNTRPVLRNTVNQHWPLISTVAANGYAGLTIIPRWASNIYYNCDTPACTVAEWVATAAGVGGWNELLALEKNANIRNLFGLHRDPFMFHQANLRRNVATVPGISGSFSLLSAWVETVLGEVVRLVNWPVVTLKHDAIAQAFRDRATRDACKYNIAYTINPTANTITGVTVTATGNTCAKPIPVTVPGTVTSTTGHTTEKIGNDPLTVWVTLKGSPVTLTLSTPIAL